MAEHITVEDIKAMVAHARKNSYKGDYIMPKAKKITVPVKPTEIKSKFAVYFRVVGYGDFHYPTNRPLSEETPWSDRIVLAEEISEAFCRLKPALLDCWPMEFEVYAKHHKRNKSLKPVFTFKAEREDTFDVVIADA